jgi:hypothetical protein
VVGGACVILASRLIAGENQWTPSGPPGRVTAITSDAPPPLPPPPPEFSTTLYAVTPAGFFESPDLGQTWKLVNAEMSSARVRAIAADWTKPGQVTAVGCGAYQTTDGGSTWISLDRGLPGGCSLERIDVDTERPGYFFASGTAGLFVTGFDDRGLFWRQSGSEYFHSSTVVATAPLRLPYVFAAPAEGGFFVSRDEGLTWSPRSGVPDGATVRDLLPQDDSRVTAVTNKGLFWTGDAGRSWIPNSNGLPDLAVNSFFHVSWGTYATTETGIFRGASGYWKAFTDGLPAATAISRLFMDRTGRRLCAVPLDQGGTYVYRYGNPAIRLTPVPAALFVGFNPDLHVEVTPEQPEPVFLALQSSDVTVLDPFGYAYVTPFTTSLAFPFFIRRASDHLVTVKVSEQLGGTTSEATVSVLNGVPQKLYVDPEVVPSGGSSFTLYVFSDNLGRAFVEGSTILWNGSPRPTSFLPGGLCPGPCNVGIQAAIPAEDIASPGSVKISVRNPPPGGGTSEAVTLIVGPRPRTSLVKPPRSRPPVRVEKPRG